MNHSQCEPRARGVAIQCCECLCGRAPRSKLSGYHSKTKLNLKRAVSRSCSPRTAPIAAPSPPAAAATELWRPPHWRLGFPYVPPRVNPVASVPVGCDDPDRFDLQPPRIGGFWTRIRLWIARALGLRLRLGCSEQLPVNRQPVWVHDQRQVDTVANGSITVPRADSELVAGPFRREAVAPTTPRRWPSIACVCLQGLRDCPFFETAIGESNEDEDSEHLLSDPDDGRLRDGHAFAKTARAKAPLQETAFFVDPESSDEANDTPYVSLP